MSLELTLRTEFVSTVLLVVSLGVSPPAAAQPLSGESREEFIKAIVEGCIKNAATDPDIAALPRAKLRSICLCSATYIAARAKPGQLDTPDTLAVRALVAEAIRACFVGKKPA